ncbi:MAG: helix-turn-helix domain-containing protein [Ruminococcus sp.]|nr:helix-turn-helix domain-containing protein [Ruminococcus sp.]
MIRNENEFYIRFEALCSDCDRLRAEVEFLSNFIKEAINNCYRTDKLLSKAEVADILGVCERTVDRYREERKLAWVMLRGRVSFEKEAVWELIRSERIEKAPKTREDFEKNYQRFVTDKRNTTWRSK